MDWKNIDLKNKCERDLNILDNYTFEGLLLEITCNIREEEMNKETIKSHALEEMRKKYEEAKNVLEDNLDNIVKESIRYSKLP